MRTTIKIDERLLAEAKARAARAGTTLNAVVEDALRSVFARRRDADADAVALPTFRGSLLQPGVDLDDSAALLERMEEPER
jgi:Arc/MetJ family transcription regulator